MAKVTIYTKLMSTKTITVKECPISGELPYNMIFNKVLSNPELFDTISLIVENTIKLKEIEFNKICATSLSAIPYATNIATNVTNSLNDKFFPEIVIVVSLVISDG